jgi:hypothetical protein
MTRATLLLTALLATMSMGALAQETTDGTTGTDTGTGTVGDTQTQTFTELDSNNDGMLDEDEVEQGNVSGDFSDIDSNGDDEVDRNEYYQHQRQQR